MAFLTYDPMCVVVIIQVIDGIISRNAKDNTELLFELYAR